MLISTTNLFVNLNFILNVNSTINLFDNLTDNLNVNLIEKFC